MQRNSKPIREPQIIGCAKALRSLHRRTGAIGFCYEEWAVFRLGAKGNNLVDCISTAHPSPNQYARDHGLRQFVVY
jgi:hypothetical protein